LYLFFIHFFVVLQLLQKLQFSIFELGIEKVRSMFWRLHLYLYVSV